MTPWRCGIEGCGAEFESPERLIEHQVEGHDPCECAICGETVHAGFPAIYHAFTEHTRADYLRSYDADSNDIRVREELIEEIEDELDVPALLESLGGDPVSTPTGD